MRVAAYLDPSSESRDERERRLAQEAGPEVSEVPGEKGVANGKVNGHGAPVATNGTNGTNGTKTNGS
jgi:hypothetical protein